MSDFEDVDFDSDVDVLTTDDEKIALPKRWAIIFHNDDITPMEFVVELLLHVYHYSPTDAVMKTKEIDAGPKAVVGVYSKEVAEQKFDETKKVLGNFRYPLKVTLEIHE